MFLQEHISQLSIIQCSRRNISSPFESKEMDRARIGLFTQEHCRRFHPAAFFGSNVPAGTLNHDRSLALYVPAGTLDAFCTHIHLLAQQIVIAFQMLPRRIFCLVALVLLTN